MQTTYPGSVKAVNSQLLNNNSTLSVGLSSLIGLKGTNDDEMSVSDCQAIRTILCSQNTSKLTIKSKNPSALPSTCATDGQQHPKHTRAFGSYKQRR